MPQAKSRNTTASEALNDPAFQIGCEIRRLTDRYNELDGRGIRPDSIDETYTDSELRHMADRIAILRDYLSAVQATSISGAIVQLHEINCTADMAFGTVDRRESGCDQRKIDRLFFSIDAVLRAAAPADKLKAIQEDSPHLSPWLAVEHRLALARARH